MARLKPRPDTRPLGPFRWFMFVAELGKQVPRVAQDGSLKAKSRSFTPLRCVQDDGIKATDKFTTEDTESTEGSFVGLILWLRLSTCRSLEFASRPSTRKLRLPTLAANCAARMGHPFLWLV
jgi:hypothetical protein